jgi:hypothetical protein
MKKSHLEENSSTYQKNAFVLLQELNHCNNEQKDLITQAMDAVERMDLTSGGRLIEAMTFTNEAQLLKLQQLRLGHSSLPSDILDRLFISHFDISHWLQARVSEFRSTARLRNIEIDLYVSRSARIVVVTDAAKLNSILINVLANALDETQQYDKIIMHVTQNRTKISIAVQFNNYEYLGKVGTALSPPLKEDTDSITGSLYIAHHFTKRLKGTLTTSLLSKATEIIINIPINYYQVKSSINIISWLKKICGRTNTGLDFF